MSKRRPPNIILINCDDLGYGDLGCYGSVVNQTPVLDRLAAEGLRFTDFYMAAPVCSPSRGAMLTGCYPQRIGFGSFDGHGVLFPGQAVGLHPDERTIAAILRDQGYATLHVGKWHCGDQPAFLPTRHGFDQYYGLPYSNDMGRQAGRERQFPPLPLLRDERVIQEQPDQASLTERYVEQAVRFMREHRAGPFLLYFAHMYVHLPLYAPARFLRESRNGAYGAAVACIDWATGVLLHELRALGLDQDTLVVFTSDNGARGTHGGSNAPLRGGKGTTWEGGMRLPCLMRWPGQIPGGTTSSALVTSLELLPTFAALAGTRPPTDRIIDGQDISRLLREPATARSPRAEFFYYWQNQLDAVRAGPWKLHVRKIDQDVRELYDLHADPGETTNVGDQHADVVRDLETRLQRCREELGDSARGIAGANCRPIGRVPDPAPLTQYDPEHPYIIGMYDLTDAG